MIPGLSCSSLRGAAPRTAAAAAVDRGLVGGAAATRSVAAAASGARLAPAATAVAASSPWSQRRRRCLPPALAHPPQRSRRVHTEPRGRSGLGLRDEVIDVSQARLDQLLEAEITLLALREDKPFTLQSILDLAMSTSEEQLARLLHDELPIRFAQRIKMLEDLPQWKDKPSIASVRQMYITSFKDLRLADPARPEQFQTQLRNISKRHSQTNLLVNGFRHYVEEDTMQLSDMNAWLDNFFSLRVSGNLLISHYLHLVKGAMQCSMQGADLSFDPDDSPYAMLVDPYCCPARIARHAARLVTRMCTLRYGLAPRIIVTDCGASSFSFVPRYLFYIFSELLKNSARATVEMHAERGELPEIEVLISGNEDVCSCRVSDEGGGIRVENLDHVWSYFYTTAEPVEATVSRNAVDAPPDWRWLVRTNAEKSDRDRTEVERMIMKSPLAGMGCGLPLSRLYASYLGGSIQLQTLPGYGTDAFVYLSRLQPTTTMGSSTSEARVAASQGGRRG